MQRVINVYSGKDNEANLQLYYKGSPMSFEGVNRMRLQIIGSTIEVDSDVDAGAIQWNTQGQIKLLLGDMGVIGERGFKIIAYDDHREAGQVILSSRRQWVNIKFYGH